MRPHAPVPHELQSQGGKLRDDGGDDLGEYDSDDDAVPQTAPRLTGASGSERPSPIDTQQRRRILQDRNTHDDLMMGAHRADSDDDDDDDDGGGASETPASKQPALAAHSGSQSKAKKPALAVDSGSGDRMDDGFGLQELPFAEGAGTGRGGDHGDDLGAFPDDEEEDDDDYDDGAMDGAPISNARGIGAMAVLESSAPGSMGSTLGSTAISFAKTGTMGGGGTRLGLSMSGAGFDSTGGSFGGTGSSFGARRRKKGGPSLLVSTGGGMAAPGVIEPSAGAGGGAGSGAGGGGLELALPGAKYDGADMDDTMGSTGIAARRRKRAGGGPSLDLSMSGSLARKRGMALSLDTGGNPGATGGMLELDGKAGDDDAGAVLAVADGNLWSTGQSPTTGTGGGLDSAFVDGDPFSTPQGQQAAGAAQAALDPRASELSDAGTLRIGGIFEVNASGILVSNPATVAAQAVLAAIEGGFDGSDSEETAGEMKEAMAKLKDGSHPAWLSESLAKALARAAVEEVEGGGTATASASDAGWGPRSIRDELVMMDALGSGASGSVQRALHIPSLRMVAVKSVRVFEAKNREQMAAELKLLYANITKLPDVAGGSSKPLVPGSTGSGVPPSISEDGEGGIAAAAAAAAAASSSGAGASIEQAEADGTGSELCPNIVRLYDAYSAKDQGAVCIVMEYMAGGSLQDLVDSGGTQNMAELATIAADSFRGLAFLHSQRQLHRDIKPANILRSNGGGECKLADFGIAKQLEGTMDMAQTWVGTMQYMSPERIDQEGGGYSYPADIWSLGLTLLSVAAGKFPYTGGQDYFAMMGAVKEDAPPLECLDAHDAAGRTISPEFRDLITRSLAKDPSRRITAAEALVHPFLRRAWRPAAAGSGARAAGLTLRALAAPKPPWASAYKPSHDKSKKIRDQLVKLLQRVCMKHFKVFARFHASGSDAAAAQKQRLGQRLDDSTFNRHKAERLLVSAGATGDFSYLAGDARTMGFLSRVAHAKALQTAGMHAGAGLSKTASRRDAASGGAAGAVGCRLEASSGAVVTGAAAAAASRAMGGVARGMGSARRSASSFDAFTSDPMTRHGRQLLMRSLAGKVRPGELGEDGVEAMSRALRAGAARVMEAWPDEEDDEAVPSSGVGKDTRSTTKKKNSKMVMNHGSKGVSAAAGGDGTAGDSMASSGLGLSGLAEFGVLPSDTVQQVTEKVPEMALRVGEASVRILADQMGLRPASVAERLNRVIEAWYRRHERKKAEKNALAQAAKSTLESPGRPKHTVRGGVKRPPSKQLPVPTPEGRDGRSGAAVQISEQADSNVIQFRDQTTTIKVMNTSSRSTGKTVSVAGVDTLIRHYGNK